MPGLLFLSPYHVRMIDVPWQQYYMDNVAITATELLLGIRIQNLTNNTKIIVFAEGFSYNFSNEKTVAVHNTLILDEVKKKLYFIHSPNSDKNFIIREATVEIVKEPNGSRIITNVHSNRLFLGNFGFKPDRGHLIHFFINPVDGSILQVHSMITVQGWNQISTFHDVSWFTLDDSVHIDAPYCRVPYAGKVKTMDKCQFEFARFNTLDTFGEYGVLFSKDGKKMVIRFRIMNPHWFTANFGMSELVDVREDVNSPDSNIIHEMTKPPTYVLFGLDYDSHTIQVLTQFVPSSVENHCELLISSRLFPIYSNGMGFLNSQAQSFLSQRSLMIGQYQKYTFFSTTHKGVIGIVAVKSLMRTLQNGQLSLTPKLVWFPLEDDEVKMAFANLSDKNIKWEMLTQKHNIILVAGNELILQIYDPDLTTNSMKQLATIRVKFGNQYKDYRKCAGCAKMEERKRRSKNGKRISQFMVCGWCKDHNLHKTLEIPCHYCSEECADSHWPVHKLEHNVKEKGAKGKNAKGKKKKGKK